jgi:outer membrane lipoprotein carrier protein
MIELMLAIALFAAPADIAPIRPPARPAPTLDPAQVEGDAEVKRAVEQMQKFYENTKDFEARFTQTYSYKTFARKTVASGRMKFMKAGASMRWDYEKPEQKVFVVAANKVYAYIKEAKQLTISSIDTDKLSASVTFLWGTGKLDREFNIKRSDRKDLSNGFALELTPKQADPRFQRIFFVLDPKTFEVKESLVVDPDGSENRIAFSEAKVNQGFGKEAFAIDPPKDTQIIRMDGTGQPPKP